MTRKKSALLLVMAAVTTVLGLASAAYFLRPKVESGGRGAPAGSVVILVADTLRADHLGCYGYGRDTSPELDAFAAQSTRYSRAFSSSPWTLPSHASMFTGKYSYEHGARTYLVRGGSPTEGDSEGKNREETGCVERPLSKRHLTLAELLSREGYETGAVVANGGYLSKRWNLHQGFDFYKVKNTRANRLNRMIFKWMDRVKENRFFLFVNYMDTHRVYNTRPRPGLLSKPAIRDKGQLLDKLIYGVMDPAKQKRGFPRDVADKVIDQYDTAVANVDEGIGEVLSYLKRLGLYDGAMIIVTSDHGEYFGEHRLVEHSKDLYQEALHVPLMIKGVGQRKAEVSQAVVSSVDIPGMVLRELGGGVELGGEKAFKRIPGNHPVIAESYYSRSKDVTHPIWGRRFKRIRAALYDYPYKYILSSDGEDEMYRLDKDGQESTNLLETDPERARRYRASLAEKVEQGWRQSSVERGDTLSDVEREQMRALGYIE